MKITPWMVLGASLFCHWSCGGDGEEFVPGAPTILVDMETKTISWDPIAGADSYNLYYKQVEDCADIETAEFQTPTKDDTKIESVTSPFSIAEYTGCTTCYYVAVAGQNGVGEGNLSRASGWQIRDCP